MSVIAFDYGTKRIGVAGGDLEMKIAAPREVLANKSLDYLEIELKKMFDQWKPSLVVIGLPVAMEDGQEENAILKDIYSFGELVESLGLEVLYYDERLSSFEAAEKAQELGVSHHKKDDALAAQIILQRYFDSLTD